MRLLFAKTTLVFLLVSCQHATNQKSTAEIPKGKDNVAYQWGAVALEATARDTERFKPRPTITSRYLGLIFTAAFDAWSRYDEKAIPVYAEEIERRPKGERTIENKQKAISYAFYHAMLEYYYSDSAYFKQVMTELGYDPSIVSTDETSPEGIGYAAARSVIEARRKDGSNQYGEVDGSNGQAYFDYTHYKPINPVDSNLDLNRWQPKYFISEMGEKYAPKCLTPYWQYVSPIGLDSASQYRPGPPPAVGSKQLEEEVAEVVEMQAKLTPKEKALVEFMRDGPKSVQQAGHWLLFAQEVSVRDQHTLDEDIKMYFYNQAVAMDAFIASWDSKMYYDFARPYALIHNYFEKDTIYGWKGPEKGWMKMLGKEWRPYSPASFLCPPFPSYTSGHSTVSGACAEALKLYTGSDKFGHSVDLVSGYLTEPNNLGDTVTLEFPTFTEAAEMAGISRVLGGYHIQADNIAGLELGREVAKHNWMFFKKHLGE